MKIQVFAVLKDYFEKEFQLTGAIPDAASLRQCLIERNPASADVLAISRFAVNDEFIDNDFQLNEHDVICIIPPASGG